MCGYTEHIFKGWRRCMNSLPWYKSRMVGFSGPWLFKDGSQCVINMDHSSWIVKTILLASVLAKNWLPQFNRN